MKFNYKTFTYRFEYPERWINKSTGYVNFQKKLESEHISLRNTL